jgi:hypothetical protein
MDLIGFMVVFFGVVPPTASIAVGGCKVFV